MREMAEKGLGMARLTIKIKCGGLIHFWERNSETSMSAETKIVLTGNTGGGTNCRKIVVMINRKNNSVLDQILCLGV